MTEPEFIVYDRDPIEGRYKDRYTCFGIDETVNTVVSILEGGGRANVIYGKVVLDLQPDYIKSYPRLREHVLRKKLNGLVETPVRERPKHWALP